MFPSKYIWRKQCYWYWKPCRRMQLSVCWLQFWNVDFTDINVLQFEFWRTYERENRGTNVFALSQYKGQFGVFGSEMWHILDVAHRQPTDHNVPVNCFNRGNFGPYSAAFFTQLFMLFFLCPIVWRKNSVDNALKLSNKLEESKDFKNFYFPYFCNISYFSHLIVLNFPLTLH